MFFFFNDTATTEIYTLSLHDALPICARSGSDPGHLEQDAHEGRQAREHGDDQPGAWRSEEHTSELQSQSNLVCRLLLEKKKQTTPRTSTSRQSPILSSDIQSRSVPVT